MGLFGKLASILVTMSIFLYGCSTHNNTTSKTEDLPSLKLFKAITCNNLPLAEEALKIGADVNSLGGGVAGTSTAWKKDQNPLSLALSWKSYSVAELLLEHGADASSLTVDGNTYLEMGGLDFARNLLEHGANINQKDKQGNTFLADCISKYTDEDLETVLDLGEEFGMQIDKAELDILDKYSDGRYKTRLRLIEKYPFAAERYQDYTDALNGGMITDENPDVLFYIAAFGSIKGRVAKNQINFMKNDGGNTLVNVAARYGNLNNVMWLCENGADIYTQSHVLKYDAFDQAVLNGQKQVLDYFMKNGLAPNPHKASELSNTAVQLVSMAKQNEIDTARLLMDTYPDAYDSNDVIYGASEAIKESNVEMLRLYLDHGAKVEHLLSDCCFYGTLEIFEVLEEYGANFSLYGEYDEYIGEYENALSHICSFSTNDDADVIRHLLDAYPELINTPGYALRESIEHGDIDVVRLLVNAGIDVNSNNNNKGTTALMCAAESTDEIFAYLLDHGADPTIANSDGETAADIVKKNLDNNKIALLENTMKNI